jgi:hypothetical protein
MREAPEEFKRRVAMCVRKSQEGWSIMCTT